MFRNGTKPLFPIITELPRLPRAPLYTVKGYGGDDHQQRRALVTFDTDTPEGVLEAIEAIQAGGVCSTVQVWWGSASKLEWNLLREVLEKKLPEHFPSYRNDPSPCPCCGR